MAAGADAVYLDDRSGRIRALDAATGSKRWSVRAHEEQYTLGITVADGRVFSGRGAGNVTALHAADGSVLWTRSDLGSMDTPLTVAGRTLYFAGRTRVYALDTATGETRWSRRAGTVLAGSIAVGDAVYCGTMKGQVLAFDLNTGVPRWAYSTAKQVFSTLAAAGGMVFAVSFRRELDEGALHAINATTGAPVWAHRTQGAVHQHPAPTFGTVSVRTHGGWFYTFDAVRGTQRRFALALPGQLAAEYGLVYFPGRDGYAYAVRRPEKRCLTTPERATDEHAVQRPWAGARWGSGPPRHEIDPALVLADRETAGPGTPTPAVGGTAGVGSGGSDQG
ncbi:PQQ-binding-like beta-propeller repeat protein [Streptomyces sp. NPDC101118]|uniref:outer membrane protein assembly factor BamB family protein n=1 Tax=Streptomyces sp. NPDC101118 TaxID=3366109 RepID=UPI00380AA9ED